MKQLQIFFLWWSKIAGTVPWCYSCYIIDNLFKIGNNQSFKQQVEENKNKQ